MQVGALQVKVAAQSASAAQGACPQAVVPAHAYGVQSVRFGVHCPPARR